MLVCLGALSFSLASLGVEFPLHPLLCWVLMGQQVLSTSLQGLLLGQKRSICVWDSRALASRHRWGRGSVQPVMVTAGPGRRQRWKPSSAVPCRASLGSLELAVL